MCETRKETVDNLWGNGPALWKLETNLDDCTGEALGYVLQRLLEKGAADVWYQPIYMKKNRPAVMLCALCLPEKVRELEREIFLHTTTIGIRRIPVWRETLSRRAEQRETRYGTVQVKVCELEGEERIYPEYESLRQICERTGKGYEQIRQEITADLFASAERQTVG